ncbi:MAG: putative BsuMI modification methylase subunit YdiO [Pelotomaculum sp. PtaU1.Bin065]|nr:MAG: putative BsuMI modification methylase subunit YdiO [Pelotomaculum sp. PtaU1.Bin065]
MTNLTFSVLHLFCGIGGEALGMQEAETEYRGINANFLNLGGIDSDPDACKDFEMFTGAPAFCMDLFSREDYIAFHGHEPPSGWREVKPEDLRRVTGGINPDVLSTSPPCKGFSGLLPGKSAASEKYQALNRLTVRGLSLVLEAFKNDPPGIILLENVPRITTRGATLLKKIKSLLAGHGYLFHEGNHDCGELGGLGQHRRRYLLIARHPNKVSNFIYQPPKQRVKSIGEMLGPLPMPDDPAGGPMHRLPRLQWKTLVRLALIPAGGDWRDLKDIKPEQYRLEYIPRGGGPFGVQDWEQPAATVIGNAAIKGSNAAAVADLRLGHIPREGVYRIQKFDEPSTTVTGAARVNTSNGAACVADPRLTQRDNRHPGVYRVVKFDDPAPCVTGTRFGSGAPTVADPRLEIGPNGYHNICRVVPWNEAANTITGATRPASGAISVADPRFDRTFRNGLYGVQAWDKPGYTVTGARNPHSGTAAVADPRIPADNERPDPPPIIISLDGTWHRALTTWELLALQGFPLFHANGSPVVLSGKNDARWRERIGNAVPRQAGEAIGMQILRTLLLNAMGTWELSNIPIWVNPKIYPEIIKSAHR